VEQRRGSRRTGRFGAVAAVLVGALVVLGCAPPTMPGPTVRDQPEDRGRVPGAGVLPSAGCDAAPPDAPGTDRLRLDVAGTPRTARLRVPAEAASGDPLPLLVSLHPFATTAADWERYSRLAATAADRGYLVVTPTGSSPGPRWSVPGGLDLGADDLRFVHALLDDLEDRFCVDRNRVVAAGFSAGAAMAQALSCTAPWRFAAVAGSGGMNLTDLCPSSPPTDVLLLHGTADPIAPPSGSTVPFAPPLGIPVDAVAATNAARAGCGELQTVQPPAPDVVVERASGCDEDHRVEHWRLVGAGHTWAGAPGGLLELVTGPTSTSVDANDVVLEFFDGASR
jgi:polyhydroxybutyrate depolymerase